MKCEKVPNSEEPYKTMNRARAFESLGVVAYHPTITSLGLTFWCEAYMLWWYSMSMATCTVAQHQQSTNERL